MERRIEQTYSGILRQFKDGTWGALCFELGLITRANTPQDVLAQMAELLEFELECIAEGDSPRPATLEMLSDFISCEAEEETFEAYGIGDLFTAGLFRIARESPPRFAVA